ncbi:uncharacterized protein METZ01_LOCUS492625, partial [marine metagenome]
VEDSNARVFASLENLLEGTVKLPILN